MSGFLPVYDVTPFTMLDFPGKTACIVWFSGCNMRCSYCHNPDIVKGKRGKFCAEDVLSFLEKRKGLLDGVVLSGGEATVYEDIIPFARVLRKMGFAVKLDTNGTRPDRLKRLLEEGLLDYVALDYKAPAAKFRLVTRLKSKEPFDKSLKLLCAQKDIPVEIRTTVHTGLLDEKDIAEIMDDLARHGFRGKYFLQNFRQPAGKTLGFLPLQGRALHKEFLPSAPFETGFRNFA